MAAVPQPGLRSMLPRGYVGFTEATTPRQLVLPATTFVPLVVKLLDSAHRPPAFVMGARGSSLVLEGDCAPSYLEVVLSPLGAYRVLGLPMAELGGQLVDLVEVLGADGRRLGEQLRQTSSWRRRFGLVDRFLLGRLEGGPRPAPEVAWAWERLVSSGGRCRSVGWPVRLGGATGLGRVAGEAGYADQGHLIRDFHQFTGSTPAAFVARTIPAGGGGGRQVNFVQDTIAAAS